MSSIVTRMAFFLAASSPALTIAIQPTHTPLKPDNNTTVLGEGGWDQMRFLQCTNGDATNFGRLFAYYDHPPVDGEHPTQIVYRGFDSIPWGNGCAGHGTTGDGTPVECDVQPYEWSENTFQAYVGDVTYGTTGFNCFMDDGHAAHYEGGDWGYCYAELYCTHQHATQFALEPSTRTVKLVQHSTYIEGDEPDLPPVDARAVVRGYLEKTRELVHGQQCSPDPIDLMSSVTMSADCDGDPGHLQKLVDGLVAVYDRDEDKGLFQAVDNRECSPQPPICNPATDECEIQPDICEFERGVEMPASYVMSVLDKYPPNSDVISHPIAQLQMDIHYVTEDNSILCEAAETAVSLLALFGPLSAIFGGVGLGLSAVCG